MVAPTLTPYLDADPCPRVEVFFPSFTAGTATVTVYRLAAGRTFDVRGAVRAATAGQLTRIDNEVPFNMPVTYRAEQFNAAGISLGFTDSTTVTLTVADSWMHNPLDPQGAAKVDLGGGTGGVVSMPTPGVVSYPLGRRVGVVVSEPRRGVAGLPVDVRTRSDADADRIQAMVGGYGNNTVPLVCLRLGTQHQRMRVTQPLFLSVLDLTEVDVNHQWVGDGGELAHTFTGNEVAPPIPGLFIPLLRRKDVNAYYATRAAVKADNLTRGALNRRYDIAGFGG